MKQLCGLLLVATCFSVSGCSDKISDSAGKAPSAVQAPSAVNQTDRQAKSDAAYAEYQKKMKDAAAKY